MRVLVTGAKGQLGSDVMEELSRRGLTGIGVDIEEMDITDAAQVMTVTKAADPDAVIHCAAYTAVDQAEDDEARCTAINADGTFTVAYDYNAENSGIVSMTGT